MFLLLIAATNLIFVCSVHHAVRSMYAACAMMKWRTTHWTGSQSLQLCVLSVAPHKRKPLNANTALSLLER